jgi:hypothetical protein
MGEPEDLPPLGAGDPREIEFEPFDYSLLCLAESRFVLAVVANQSAFYYMMRHELTAAEVAEYRTGGKAFLERLARRVRYHADVGGD